MPRIELAQLLRPTTTPEQELLLEHFYSQFDNRSAANKQIVNVEPLFYQGVIAGSEFLVYAATKLYIGYIAEFYHNGVSVNLNGGIITFHDQANNIFLYAQNNYPAWDATTPVMRYFINPVKLNNIYFSRIETTIITNMKFTGYRVTLI